MNSPQAHQSSRRSGRTFPHLMDLVARWEKQRGRVRLVCRTRFLHVQVNRPSDCQRQRRNQAQRERRRSPRKKAPLTRRLKPPEAAWLKKHPLIIGLISVLMGSTDLNEIEAFCAAASERGRRILNGELPQESQNLTENKGITTPVGR